MSAARSIKCTLFLKIYYIYSVLDNLYFSRFIQPMNPSQQAHDSESLLYSHICHSSPIATLCYILLSDFLALEFALMSNQGKSKLV